VALRVRVVLVAGGHGRDHPLAGRSQHFDAPVQQRPAGAVDERLRAVGSETIAAAAGGDDRYADAAVSMRPE
jgi:hypothetical protein